jgi:hypothetical protein
MKTKLQSIRWLALAALAICPSQLFIASAQDASFTNNVYLFGSYPVCVVAADFTGRGKPDLVAAIGNSFDVLDVLTNKGDGTFAFATAYFTGGSPLCLATADVNGNGQADLICGVSPNLLVLTNNGHGVFGTNGIYYVGNSPQSVAVADVNGDGSQDLIAANYNDNTVTVLTNNGGGIFFSNATYGAGSGPRCVVAADINGDGTPDLVVADYGDSTLMVLTNNGSGVFGTNKIYDLLIFATGDSLPTSLVAADVNGDGKPDLIVGNRNGALTVLTNNGHGTFGFNAIYGVSS